MKRSRKTALVLMGSAPLLLVACAQQPEVQTSEGLFTSVEACASETMNPGLCREAFEAAQAQADEVAPRYTSLEECEAEFGEGQCGTRQHAGGSFVVSPDTSSEVIARTRARGMQSYPGVFSPTDAFRALRAGATGLKFFPAEILGPKGIRAMKAVLPPELPLYAVGGANPDNFREYFAAGCAGFGLGSYLYKPGMKIDDIRSRAATAVAAYDEEKGK